MSTETELPLMRIADALERIAAALEPSMGKTEHCSLYDQLILIQKEITNLACTLEDIESLQKQIAHLDAE